MLACPIENYKFRALTPTEELMVMCRMLLEVGDYASTILDRAHQTFSRKCLSVNQKVEKELVKRKAVGTPDDIYDAPTERINCSDLSALSIAQLETLYRQWKLRFNERLKDRRETLTRFFETRIVNEMKSRENVSAVEQLMTDYCDRTNRNELHNIGAIMQKPLGQAYFDISQCRTPQQMIALFYGLRRYKTISEREMLIEAAEKAMDFVARNRELSVSVNLAAELVDLDFRRRVSCPNWIKEYLIESVNRWKKQPMDFDRDKVIPYITIFPVDKSARWRAVRTVNTCYRNCIAPDTEAAVSDFIEDLYMAEQCNEFVIRYNVRKMAAAWNRCCDTLDLATLTTTQITKLLFVAEQVGDFAPVSPDHLEALIALIAVRATTGDFEAEMYSRFHNSKSNEYAAALKKA